MTKLDEMWAALAAYQPQADAAGHGESWAAMCQQKTSAYANAAAKAAAAAAAAADASAVDVVAAAVYAANAAAAAVYVVAAAVADAETWAQLAIDRISKVLKVAEPVALAEQGEPVELREALASALTSTYVCMRVWEAWHVGTMTEDDFFPASECDELLDELVHAVATTPPQPAPVQQEPESWAMEFISNMLKTQPANSLLASQVFHELAAQLNRRALPQALAEQPAQQELTALTAGQVNALLKATGYGDASALEQVAFMVGLRHGEFAHNIKGNT